MPSEIRWIESRNGRSLKPRLSVQVADDVGFHLANGGLLCRGFVAKFVKPSD
jgi:hypothetical protein